MTVPQSLLRQATEVIEQPVLDDRGQLLGARRPLLAFRDLTEMFMRRIGVLSKVLAKLIEQRAQAGKLEGSRSNPD